MVNSGSVWPLLHLDLQPTGNLQNFPILLVETEYLSSQYYKIGVMIPSVQTELLKFSEINQIVHSPASQPEGLCLLVKNQTLEQVESIMGFT